jgi:hypothetical protein
MSEPAAPRSVRHWWNRLTATILALGALAAAIGGILGLRSSILDLQPAPDPVDSASVKLQAESPVPLSEAQAWLRARASQRAGSAGPQTRPAPVRRLQPDASAQADPTSDTSASDPSSSSSEPTASSSGSTSSTPSTASHPTSSGLGTAPTVVIDPPAGIGQEKFGNHVDEVLKHAEERAPSTIPKSCRDGGTCAIAQLALGQAVGPNGELVEPDVAAERLVELLKDTRAGGDGSRTREPLGVLVTVNLELIGLRDQEVRLTWSMLATGGATKRLYGDWLNDNLAYRLKAGSDRDTAFQYIWIPLPKSPGPYFVRVELTVDGAPLTSEASDPFD